MNTLDAKARNFLKFVQVLQARYSVPDLLFQSMNFDPEELLNDPKKRKDLFEQFLPMAATSTEGTINAVLLLRDFFEVKTAPEREQFVDEVILEKLKEHIEKTQKVLAFVEENKQQ